jgi:Integrase core domain
MKTKREESITLSFRNKYTAQSNGSKIKPQWTVGEVDAVHGNPARSEAKYQVFEYIEVYCNWKRLHPKLGYLSPEAFEVKKSLCQVFVKSGHDQPALAQTGGQPRYGRSRRKATDFRE